MNKIYLKISIHIIFVTVQLPINKK